MFGRILLLLYGSLVQPFSIILSSPHHLFQYSISQRAPNPYLGAQSSKRFSKQIVIWAKYYFTYHHQGIFCICNKGSQNLFKFCQIILLKSLINYNKLLIKAIPKSAIICQKIKIFYSFFKKNTRNISANRPSAITFLCKLHKIQYTRTEHHKQYLLLWVLQTLFN